MKVALLSLALLGQPVAIPVSDKVPVLNVEALCKATVEEDKAMGLTETQSFSGCMDDETQAQQQVGTMWAASPSDVRHQCETTATTGGCCTTLPPAYPRRAHRTDMRGEVTILHSTYFGAGLPVVAGWSPRLSSRQSSWRSWRSSRRSSRRSIPGV
jgi:hypothetical protein